MFRSVMQWVSEELAQWRRRSNIALAKLSDHQLDDIGLRRDQLFMLEIQNIDEERDVPVRVPVFRPEFEPCG